MIRVAAIQMTSHHHLQDNLNTAERLVSQAASSGAKVVALPENFAYMGLHESDKIKVKEPLGDGPIQAFLAQVAKQHQIYLLGGTIPLTSPDEQRVYAASLFYSPDGQCLSHYHKIHLFDVRVSDQEAHRESNSVIAGKEVVDVETPLGHFGFSVCYDLRFPELYRQLNLAGVNIIFVPAAFTYVTGLAHWEVLLRARAVENLSYVVAPNQTGFHSNGRRSFGHSQIINHWGEVLNCLHDQEGVVLADIDLDNMNEKRMHFPSIEHRQLF